MKKASHPIILNHTGHRSRFRNLQHESWKKTHCSYFQSKKKFHQSLGLTVRNGTDTDRDNLQMTLGHLDFEVHVYNDLPYKKMENILEELSRDDHSDADCIAVAILSHGGNGFLYSFDQQFKPDQLWTHFVAEKCPTLAGKPKIFFVQVSANFKIVHYI